MDLAQEFGLILIDLALGSIEASVDKREYFADKTATSLAAITKKYSMITHLLRRSDEMMKEAQKSNQLDWLDKARYEVLQLEIEEALK